MKVIIAASLTTALLLCSGSVATHAQTLSSPMNIEIKDPKLDVSKMAPNQREYLVVETMKQQPTITPEMLAKVKDIYGKAKPEIQLQMATQTAQQLAVTPPLKDKVLKNMPAPEPAK